MKKILASLMALLVGLTFLLVSPIPVMADTGEIQGIKWNDQNGDGINQSSEPFLSEVKVYLDLNNNGVVDPDEPTQVTDVNGQYQFTGLEPDTYIVREIVPTGYTQTFPKAPKKDEDVSSESLLDMIQPNEAVAATFIGNAGVSTDGLGTTGTGTIQAEVPAGSKVEYAFLHVATRQIKPAQIGFDGNRVSLTWLDKVQPGPAKFNTGKVDVTNIVANKIGSSGGTFNFTVDETVTGNAALVEGTSLEVIYSNPKLPEKTILLFEGGLTGPTPQITTLYLNEAIDPTIPGFTAQMALASQFSVLNGTQYSTIDVNGKRLTSSAGNYDDGAGANGQLVTVGGVGDPVYNPPNSGNTRDANDHELYNLVPFLKKGDSSIELRTANPSDDDSIFMVAITFPGAASAEERGSHKVEIESGQTVSDINFGNLLTGNVPPKVDNSIPDQTGTATEPFSFTVASNTFSDANGDSLTFSATLANGDPLPSWLSFNPNTLTFSGTPAEGDVGSISIKVIADDGRGGTQSDTFAVEIKPVDVCKNVDPENLVVNGSFETPVVNYLDFAGSIEGWQLSNGFVIEIDNEFVNKPSEGSQFIELDSNQVTKIYQDIPTSVGKTYKLTFAFSPRPDILDNKLNVSWENTLVSELEKSGEGLSASVWEVYTYELKADSTSTRLSFDNLNETSDGLGSYFDAVKVQLCN